MLNTSVFLSYNPSFPDVSTGCLEATVQVIKRVSNPMFWLVFYFDMLNIAFELTSCY